MSALWNWLRWISLPVRQRWEIEALDEQEAILLAWRARIDRQMAEMGMDHEKWWAERGRDIFEGRRS